VAAAGARRNSSFSLLEFFLCSWKKFYKKLVQMISIIKLFKLHNKKNQRNKQLAKPGLLDIRDSNVLFFQSLFKGIVSRDFVVCFLVSFDRSDISTHQEWVLLPLKVCFRFSCLGVVSPRRKMAPKFVQVRGSYTRFFYCLCWLLLPILLRKMAPNFEHVKRAPDRSKEPRTGSVTSFNVIPP
jgi:hypothetical protein